MAVVTGIAPSEILALDGEMFDALVSATSERWTNETELAARSLEVAHAHLLAFVRANSKKSARLPEPLQVERPGAPVEEATPTPVSLRGLADLAGSSVEVRGAER